MADITKLNALVSKKVRDSAADLVADIKDDLSRALDRLRSIGVTLDESEVRALLPPAPPPAAPPSGGASFDAIRRALLPIEEGRTQIGVLGPLVEQAASFAARTAVFVIKQNAVIGWRAMGFDSLSDADVKKIQLPVQQDSLFKTVKDTPCILVSSPEKIPGGKELVKKLGGSPTVMGGFPIVTKNRIAAILYADNGAAGGAFNAEALAVLAQVTGMAVDLIGVRPKDTLAVAFRKEIVEETPAATSAAPSIEEDEFALDLDGGGSTPPPPPAPPKAAPADDVSLSFVDEEEPAPPVWAPPPPPRAAAPPPPPAAAKKMPSAGFDAELSRAVEDDFGGAEAEDEEIAFEDAPSPSPITPPPAPAKGAAAKPPAAAPARGAAAAALEAEDDEQEEARRFARLLVSEIKLYNEEKTMVGRKKRDIYERLKEDIERSRKVYNERVPASVTAKRDYFYEEMVASLAGGDPGALGNYPHKPR